MKGSNSLPSLVKKSCAQVKDINNQLGSEGSPSTLGPGHALDMYKNANLYLKMENSFFMFHSRSELQKWSKVEFFFNLLVHLLYVKQFKSTQNLLRKLSPALEKAT